MPKEKSSMPKKLRKRSGQQNTLLSTFLRLFTGKNNKIASLCEKIAEESNWKLQHISKKSPGKGEKGIRPIINKEALSALKSKKPRLCIKLIDTYFRYYSNNLHGQLIKAEASHALHRNDEALKSLKKILAKKNNKFQDKVFSLFKLILAEEALELEKAIPPKQAIEYYFNQLVKLKIAPTYNEGLKDILEKIAPTEEEATPELQEHKLILKFNTEVAHLFEKKLNKRLF
tara:strand:- start:380 stop:1069 length:690 start_codon:yes stop_codon:yes gene_type:complete